MALEKKLPILVIYGDEGCREEAAAVAKRFIYRKQIHDNAPPSAAMLPFVYVDVDSSDGTHVTELENEFGFKFKTRGDLTAYHNFKLPVAEILGTDELNLWSGSRDDKVESFVKYLDDNFSSEGTSGSDEYAGFWWWVQDDTDFGHTLFVK